MASHGRRYTTSVQGVVAGPQRWSLTVEFFDVSSGDLAKRTVTDVLFCSQRAAEEAGWLLVEEWIRHR